MASFNGLGTKISLDARLPNPAILTCNQDLPLRIFVTRLDASPEPLALLSVNIELIGNTRVRAHDVIRNEYTRWIIVNDLNTPAGERRLLQSNRETSKGALLPPNEMQLVVNANIWRGRPLPPTVAPSFGSCAIGRSYELVIKIGIGYGQTPTQNVSWPVSFLEFTHSNMLETGYRNRPTYSRCCLLWNSPSSSVDLSDVNNAKLPSTHKPCVSKL